MKFAAKVHKKYNSTKNTKKVSVKNKHHGKIKEQKMVTEYVRGRG